jgi:outer membrane murein-binding lipoprotein Lpp
MGYSPENREKGKTATHVILTMEEYSHLVQDLNHTKDRLESTKSSAKREIEACQLQSENSSKAVKLEAQKRIETIQNELNTALNSAKSEVSRLNDLNANLLRISKERANARRKIKPKKEHHGYRVLDSQQYTCMQYWKKNKRSENLSCWKVRIQSPYDSSIPYETIMKNIYNDLIKVFGGSLGIDSICDLNKQTYDDFHKLWGSDKNIIFKTSYKSNTMSGLWEIEYLVKLSITIPEDMRVKFDDVANPNTVVI